MNTFTAWAERGSDFFTSGCHDMAHKAVDAVCAKLGIDPTGNHGQTSWKYADLPGCVRRCEIYDKDTGDTICELEWRA